MLILASHLSYVQDSFSTKLLQLFFFNSHSVFVLCFLSFFPSFWNNQPFCVLYLLSPYGGLFLSPLFLSSFNYTY